MTAATAPAAAPAAPPAGVGPAGPARARWPATGWVGVALVGTFLVLAVLAPVIRPYSPDRLVGTRFEAPSGRHVLGTNQIGQDLASQMLDGARVSLTVGALAAAGTLVLCALAGLLAGWRGGWVDTVLMRVIDVFLGTPRVPLLLVIGVYAGRRVVTVALVIALMFWPGAARAIRAQVLSLRRRTHVRAAVGFGAGTVYVLRRHLVPELALILAVQLLGAAGRAVSIEAGLAFLGVGDPSRTSWGSIMQQARRTPGLFYGPEWLWFMLPPIVAILLVLLGLTFVSLALEQRLDPRVARHPARAS